MKLACTNSNKSTSDNKNKNNAKNKNKNKSNINIKTKWFYDFEKELPSLAGKTVAITGCTTGTGFVTARTAIKKGAENVLLLNRASQRADAADEELKRFRDSQTNHTDTAIETIICDLQDFDSVRQASNYIRSKFWN